MWTTGAITLITLAARRPVRDLDRAEQLDRFQKRREDPSENRHFTVFRLYCSGPLRYSRRNVGDVAARCSLSSFNRLPHRHRVPRRYRAVGSRFEKTDRQVPLIVMLVCFFPANIYSAIYRIDFGGHASVPPICWLEFPSSYFLMWWIYRATEQICSGKKASGMQLRGTD